MILAHLIGGNEVAGIRDGKVIVDDKELKTSYFDLVQVCGNISLGEIDTSLDEEDFKYEYIREVERLDIVEDAEKFVEENKLTKEICYSCYEVDFENKTLVLKVEIYD